MVVSPRLLGSLAGLLLCLSTAALAAQPVDDATRASARDLGMAGVEAYQAGNYAAANEKLDKAYRALRAPSLGLWSARALTKLGKLLEASERYVEVTRLDVTTGDVAVQKQAQAEAATEREALTARIPSVVIQVEAAAPSQVTVLLDGARIPNSLIGEKRPANPGRHKLEAFTGSDRAVVEITLDEGEHETVVLKPSSSTSSAGARPEKSKPAAETARPDARPISLRTVGLVVGGAGLVGLAVGTGFALRAKGLDADSKANGHCDGSGCDATGYPLNQDALEAADLSTVLFIAGGVLTATGVTLFVVGGSASEKRARLGVAPLVAASGGGVRIHGGF